MNIKFIAGGIEFVATGNLTDDFFDFKTLTTDDGLDAIFLIKSSSFMDLIDPPAYKAARERQFEESIEASLSDYESRRDAA